MRARFRAYLWSESGAIGIGTLFSFAIAVLAVYLLVGATQADTAHFGSAPVPGTASLQLSKGETEIYYATATGTGTPFVVPTDLNVQISDSVGTALEVDARGDSPKDTDTGKTELIASVSIPADGTYAVTTTGAPAQGTASPEITFGQSPFSAVKDRASNVVDVLIGPVGIAVLALLALLFLYSRVRAAARQSGRKEPDYSEYP
jgi:hypothetical protein